MDRQKQRNMITDAFILQGELESISEKVQELSNGIADKLKELNRLSALKDKKDAEEIELKGVEAKKVRVEGELSKLLKELDTMNIKLPLGREPANKTTRL